MTHRLAIIIPAYKAAFLPAALDSIAMQTCKDFTLYVGDDCSPEPISDIVEQYRDKIELVYQRFDTNLGGKDLVAQWERCIAMSQDEPYIWLFSDDDLMEPNCVEGLLNQIEKTEGAYDVYHFNVDIINERGAFKCRQQDYPAVLSAYRFYRGKNSMRLSAFVVENVFSRKVYERFGGFMKYDLAWGSDIATWIVFCGEKGMCTVPHARIKWRQSSYQYFGMEPDIYNVNRAIFICKIHQYKKHVSKACLKEAFTSFFEVHGRKWDWPLIYLFAFLVDGIYFRIRERFYWLYGDIKE